MEVTYLRQCRNFSEAINTLRFELRVPEYYDPYLSDYFRSTRKQPNPIVNGEEVTWEEYQRLYPDQAIEKPESFIPSMIYRAEDLNMCVTFMKIPGIIDLCDNNVPFDFTNYYDVEWIIRIMDGYVEEVKNYLVLSAELNEFVNRLNNARLKIYNLNENIKILLNSKIPKDKREPLSIAEILSKMAVGGK